MVSNSDFLKIGITIDGIIAGEGELINNLLETGVIDIMHIRKPTWEYEELKKLLLSINSSYYSKIKLHDHFELINEMGLRGAHLNFRNPYAKGVDGKLSCSLHSLTELAKISATGEINRMEYVTLSPIYDSISKKGYKAAFNLREISKEIKDRPVIALGGITPENFEELRVTGFKGAALSGALYR